MKARIYYRLNVALVDLGLSDAFVPNEKYLLETITHLYRGDLLALQQKFLKVFPDASVEKEKIFCSSPMYLSQLVSTSAEKHQIGPTLDQMRMDDLIAAWEDTNQEKYPTLRWLLEKQPREKTLPRELRGSFSLHSVGPLYNYHLHIFPEAIPELSLQGINDATGQSFFSEIENNGVITLDFALDLGQRILLWCYQGQEKSVVALALLRQMGHLIVEKEEGIHIRPMGRDTVSGGFSTSP